MRVSEPVPLKKTITRKVVGLMRTKKGEAELAAEAEMGAETRNLDFRQRKRCGEEEVAICGPPFSGPATFRGLKSSWPYEGPESRIPRFF